MASLRHPAFLELLLGDAEGVPGEQEKQKQGDGGQQPQEQGEPPSQVDTGKIEASDQEVQGGHNRQGKTVR